MKANVVKSFVSKTGKLYTVGTTVEFDESRIDALVKQGFLAKSKEKPAAKADVKKPNGGA
jgi:hypothetical protein